MKNQPTLWDALTHPKIDQEFVEHVIETDSKSGTIEQCVFFDEEKAMEAK